MCVCVCVLVCACVCVCVFSTLDSSCIRVVFWSLKSSSWLCNLPWSILFSLSKASTSLIDRKINIQQAYTYFYTSFDIPRSEPLKSQIKYFFSRKAHLCFLAFIQCLGVKKKHLQQISNQSKFKYNNPLLQGGRRRRKSNDRCSFSVFLLTICTLEEIQWQC